VQCGHKSNVSTLDRNSLAEDWMVLAVCVGVGLRYGQCVVDRDGVADWVKMLVLVSFQHGTL